MVYNKRTSSSRPPLATGKGTKKAAGKNKPNVVMKRKVVMKREEFQRSEPVAPPLPPPLPPSLAQITSLITSINKDVALLCTVRPRSRDAKLVASGIARACEEIATRCRDYAGVEADEVADASRIPPAPMASATPATAAWTPLPRVSPVTPPAASPRAPETASAPASPSVIAPAHAGVTQKLATTKPVVKTPPTSPTPDASPDVSENDGKHVNHALVLVGREEPLDVAAGRLGAGVSCSYIGRAAQVRHISHKGFLSEGSRVILVRDNGEVIGHLPWSQTERGEGGDAKTYFIYANPTQAIPASGTINLEDVKLSVPVAVGPSVINRGYAESDPARSVEFTATRARIGAAAEAVCWLNK